MLNDAHCWVSGILSFVSVGGCTQEFSSMITHTLCVCCGAGYPQLLSGHMTMPGQVAKSHQTVLFPEASITTPWTRVNQAKRYQLIFPFYPFRTLCPRELAQTKLSPSSFDGSSPLFPAHTQLNITMKRRPAAQLLNYMLPENLDTSCGNAVGTLTEAERNTAVQYTFKEENVQDDAEVQITRHFRVLSVNILLKEVYLQVTTKGDSSTQGGGVVAGGGDHHPIISFSLLIGAASQVQVTSVTGTTSLQSVHLLPFCVHTLAESLSASLSPGLGEFNQTYSCLHFIYQVRERGNTHTLLLCVPHTSSSLWLVVVGPPRPGTAPGV